MRSRLSQLFLVPALAAAAALASGIAHAAETINVPFEFTAQGHSFPGGAYTIEQDPGKHLVILRQVKGDAVLNWTTGLNAESERDQVLMNFAHSADGTYVLNSIQFGRRFDLVGSPMHGMPIRPMAVRN